MSIHLDKIYINYIASRLENFSWIRSTVANCRCIICGDSQKSKSKRRFYFYINDDGNGMNVQCKNCGYSRTFRNFLNEIDSSLYQEYRVESFKEYFGSSYRGKSSDIEEVKEPIKIVRDLGPATCIIDLPETHQCRKYVSGRKIPEKHWEHLFYHNNYKEFVSHFLDEEFFKNLPEDPRLIIPAYDAFGNLKFFQGRSLDPRSNMRYITIKMDESYDKIYGEDRVDRSKTVYCTEGPLDSLFIDNCVASCDSDLLKARADVYIFDAQYRNKEICRRIEDAIEKGVKVVLFPPKFIWKDINDAVKDGGLSLENIKALIDENTFQGVRARMKFSQLKKI